MIAFNNSITDFCREYKAVPPFIAIDQEGGFVNRLRGLTGPLPSAGRVSECLPVDKAYRFYYLQGIQMKALGFHLNLAPVAEPVLDDNKKFLEERSFGDVQKVLQYGTAAVNGFQNAGIGAVLKHFPGNTNTDPHTGLPEIIWNKDEVDRNCISIFSSLFLRVPAGVLMSHARMASSDSSVPACLSSFWVDNMLRNRLNYEGIVFSDDIFMDALQKNGFPPERAVVMAINAGVDCILLSEKRFAPVAAILLDEAKDNPDFNEKIDKAVRRIIAWKIQANILSLQCGKNNEWTVCIPDNERLEDRLQKFLPALSENIEIYKTYFGNGAAK